MWGHRGRKEEDQASSHYAVLSHNKKNGAQDFNRGVHILDCYWHIQYKQKKMLTSAEHTGGISPKSPEALIPLFPILSVPNPELHQQHSPKPLM